MRRKNRCFVDNHLLGTRTGNSFLDSLQADTQRRLLPLLTRTSLQRGQVLSEPGVIVESVWFPIQSVISTLTQMADGRSIEVGFAGHEGMSPLSIAFGSLATSHTTIVQIPGSACLMNAASFVQLVNSDPHLSESALAFAEYSFIAASQFAGCNRLHSIDARYARWLLMAEDRTGGEGFTLTHEFTGEMLGVRRASVTDVAIVMSGAGLISYHRGNITVLDRQRLEKSACECYGKVNAELLRLMGYEAAKHAELAAV
jgi:CRP-like cAMP-binding protein